MIVLSDPYRPKGIPPTTRVSHPCTAGGSAWPTRTEARSLGDRADAVEPAGDATLDALPAHVALEEVLREGARDALRLERVRRVHQLQVQVRGGRVPGMADASDLVAGTDHLPSHHGDAARREVRV